VLKRDWQHYSTGAARRGAAVKAAERSTAFSLATSTTLTTTRSLS